MVLEHDKPEDFPEIVKRWNFQKYSEDFPKISERFSKICEFCHLRTPV